MASVQPAGDEHWVPNIILGQDYDRRYLDARILRIHLSIAQPAQESFARCNRLY